MTEMLTQDIIRVLNYLLPGFLAAWVFNSLTLSPTFNQLERIVQALILNLFVQIFSIPTKEVFFFIGKYFTLGNWTEISSLFTFTFYGFLIGLILSFISNNDKIHLYLRKYKLTKKTSLSSLWYSAFYNNERYLVIQMKDGKRIQGYPIEWPSDPEDTHILLKNVSWIKRDGTPTRLKKIESFLLSTDDIRWIEFQKSIKEIENEPETRTK